MELYTIGLRLVEICRPVTVQPLARINRTKNVIAEKNPYKEPVADISDDPIVLGLKQLYDSVLDEAIPDDFMGLLSQIDATLQTKSDTQSGLDKTAAGPSDLDPPQ